MKLYFFVFMPTWKSKLENVTKPNKCARYSSVRGHSKCQIGLRNGIVESLTWIISHTQKFVIHSHSHSHILCSSVLNHSCLNEVQNNSENQPKNRTHTNFNSRFHDECKPHQVSKYTPAVVFVCKMEYDAKIFWAQIVFAAILWPDKWKEFFNTYATELVERLFSGLRSILRQKAALNWQFWQLSPNKMILLLRWPLNVISRCALSSSSLRSMQCF